MITQVTIAGLKCQLYLPKEYENCSERYPVIYVNGEIAIEEILEELKQREISPEFLMLSIKPHNWNEQCCDNFSVQQSNSAMFIHISILPFFLLSFHSGNIY